MTPPSKTHSLATHSTSRRAHDMRFYVVHDSTEATIGCETTLAAAHAYGRNTDPESYGITRVDCPVNVETIRRLLGNLGGYAVESTTRGYSRNKACWRPSHLVEMTRAANTAKGNRDNPRDTSAARKAMWRKRNGEMAQAYDGVLGGTHVGPDPVFDDGHGGIS